MVCTLHCALCSVLCCALLWYAVWESNTALCPVHCTFHCIMHRALCSVLWVALVWYTVSESNTVLSLSTLKPITLLVWSANLEQANKQYRFLYPPPLHDRWAVSKSGCITQCSVRGLACCPGLVQLIYGALYSLATEICRKTHFKVAPWGDFPSVHWRITNLLL